MFKDILKLEQPVAYKTLHHALVKQKVAHAYLFSGPSGTPKKECAYLLAQSLVCQNCDQEGFACEVCNECKRIHENNFSDMKILDGSTTQIKKDSILKLQQQFNKTGLEYTGKKIYILNRAENTTPEALNSLLKFLEEPGSDMIAILLVEQIDRVLPTIISRCQNVPFPALTWEHCFTLCKEEMDELDAYVLSNMIRNRNEILETYESDEYQHSLYMFKKFQEEFLNSPYYALSILTQEGFENKKKRNGKQSMQYFLEMLMIFYKDVLCERSVLKQEWYADMISAYQMKTYPVAELLNTLLECRDKLFRSVNLNLLSDQLVYNMKEVIKNDAKSKS